MSLAPPQLDFVDLFSGVACHFQVSFAANFAIHMCTLPCLIFLLLCSWMIVRVRNPSNVSHATLTNRVVKGVALLAFLMYPGLGVKIFQVFKCRQIDDVWYFTFDYEQRCFEGTHQSLLGAAWVFIFLYVLGLPLLLFLSLYHNRTMIKTRSDSTDASVSGK